MLVECCYKACMFETGICLHIVILLIFQGQDNVISTIPQTEQSIRRLLYWIHADSMNPNSSIKDMIHLY